MRVDAASDQMRVDAASDHAVPTGPIGRRGRVRIRPGSGPKDEHPADPVVPLTCAILSVTAALAGRPVRAFGDPCRSGGPGVICRRQRAEAAFTGDETALWPLACRGTRPEPGKGIVRLGGIRKRDPRFPARAARLPADRQVPD